MSEPELIKTLYGVGYGDRGYGQKLENTTSALARISSHQGISIPQLVANGADTPELIVEKLEDSRLVAASESLALVPSCLEHTKNMPWSRPLKSVVDARFSDEDKARFFFNTGGTLLLRVTHSPSSPTRLDEDFISNLRRIGMIHIGARSCRSSTGAISPFGFYDIEKTDFKLWDDSNILLMAKRTGYRGKRGGNGNGIRLTLTLRPPSHRVGNALSPGTIILWGHTRATTYLSGIIPPSYINVSNP